ncbi:hypothetical protein LCGC14_2185070 [marine sediment metagenome]|uniref:Uncharacterized protein n=1 Tax=marine sediment metagenome TaxID=412755 RepID=A0A0F9DL41_9ZZZZ
MKLEVFGHPKEVEEKIVMINMVRKDYGIQVFICDKNGSEVPTGNILFINENGVRLNGCFGSDFGLPTDRDYIRIV